MTESEEVATLAPLVLRGDWLAVIKASTGARHCDTRRVWALVFIVVYGPPGTARSRCDEHDQPDPAKCFDLSDSSYDALFGAMARATNMARQIVAYHATRVAT